VPRRILAHLLRARRSRPKEASYRSWHSRYGALTADDRAAIRRHISRISWAPKFSVLLGLPDAGEPRLAPAIESVRKQLYPNWELRFAGGASLSAPLRSQLRRAAAEDSRIQNVGDGSIGTLALTTGDFVLLLHHADEITEHALYVLADTVCRDPDVEVIYTDEDTRDDSGTFCNPFFKPDWNPDLLLSENYLGRLFAVRRSLAMAIEGFHQRIDGSGDYELALHATSHTSRIRHVPFVLHHRHLSVHAADESSALTAVQELVGDAARVEKGPLPGTHRIRWGVPSPLPLVSLILPTRDGRELLEPCMDSILAKTGYRNFEILIVDNQSRALDALDYISSLERRELARVLRFDAPFNFSAINNFAARHARGTLLGLLNNDLEVTDGGWLEEMVSQALRPEIGVVGARLLYPDGSVQHGGIILGIAGAAGHSHKHARANSPGYIGRAQLVQNFSAITGACLVVRKDTFEKVRGLDESFAVAYNDVDFCLRVRDLGLRNLWTPFATLIHHESSSRGPEDGSRATRKRFRDERRRFIARWGEALRNDPAYNPNLTLEAEDFSLAWPPRARKPWRERNRGLTPQAVLGKNAR